MSSIGMFYYCSDKYRGFTLNIQANPKTIEIRFIYQLIDIMYHLTHLSKNILTTFEVVNINKSAYVSCDPG